MLVPSNLKQRRARDFSRGRGKLQLFTN